MVGVFTILGGALQLIVPSYGLRLIRRFGAEEVGWFLVTAFAVLGGLHLLEPLKIMGGTGEIGIATHLMHVIASILLLVGLGHIESLCVERRQAKDRQTNLQSQWQLRVDQECRCKKDALKHLAIEEAKERAIEKSEAQYRSLFQENPQPMWIFDLRSLRFLAVNNAALRQYGLTNEEFLALTPRDLLPPSAAAAFTQDVAKPCVGAEARGIWCHHRKDRSLMDVEITATDLKYGDCPARLVVATDVTQRLRRERESLQGQKMENIGQLAAGAAHHYNNILTVVHGQANLLLHKANDPVMAEALTQICSAGSRAAALTRQLLASAGKLLMHKQVVDLNQLIRDRSAMVKRLVGDSIVVETCLKANLPGVSADPHLLEHVLINLVLNAREALAVGGKVTISTDTIRVKETPAAADYQIEPGEFVRISIEDNGCGMSPEIKARLFEPFFTTREIGRGSGLGLASVYGTVKQHAGWVECTSEPGVGTEFRVFLPCAPVSMKPTPGPGSIGVARTGKTIMLVEPKDRARAMARFILERWGYRIIEVDSAPMAMLFWEQQSANIDLLITDLHLPGQVTGAKLAERLRQTKPDLKVIYTSEPDLADSSAAGHGLTSIAKPYNPDRLLLCVSEVLSGRVAKGDTQEFCRQTLMKIGQAQVLTAPAPNFQ